LPDRRNATSAPELSTRAKVGNLTARGLGILYFTGSALQIYQDFQTLRSGGDKMKSTADIGAGYKGVVLGVAIANGRIALSTATIDLKKNCIGCLLNQSQPRKILIEILRGFGFGSCYKSNYF